jgi:hypothetical protein
MNRMEVEASSEKCVEVDDHLTVLMKNSASLGELRSRAVGA